MSDVLDLTGKVAIVTGGGRGIGREITRTLARAGADIAIAEIIAENGDDCASEIYAMGRQAINISTDVTDSQSVEAMTQAVIDKFGKIDILVCNAGVAQHIPAEDMSDTDWLRVININLNGVFWCCRSVGRRMLAAGNGSIVNIGSMSGSISNKPQPQSHYNASKAAVIHLTKSLAGEWASRGVRVNCVSPGYIGTEMTKGALENKEMARVWLEMTPMGRIGDPVDVANAVLYLASDAAKFATGTDLIVDGGYTAW